VTEARAQLIRERVHCAMRMAQIDIELGRLPPEVSGDAERVNEATVASEEMMNE
jgi:hypothetical protein